MENTPHEGKMAKLNNKLVFFRVQSVDKDARTVQCVTWSAPDEPGDDLTLSKVKTLSMSNHVNGAESIHLPEAGACGVIAFVESQPYILGYFHPDDPDSVVSNDKDFNNNRTLINSGDTIFYQKLKNFIAIRNSGVIEIESTPLLKILMLPDRGELSTFCLNYDFQANGGSVVWATTDKEKTTKLTAIIKDQVGAKKVIRIEGGNVDDDHILTLKTGTPNKAQGIDAPNFSLAIKDTGETTVKVNDATTLNITDTGVTTFTSKLNLNISIEDAIAISSKKTLLITSDKDMTVKTLTKLLAEAENIILEAKTSGKAGAGASEPMVLGNMLLKALKILIQVFNTHFHPYTDDGSPSITQPPVIPATPVTDSILSKKWKVE